MNLYDKNISELSALLENKECSSVDIAKSIIERTNNAEKEIDAYLYFDENSIIEQANIADKKRANGEGTALTGIPIGIKDNINVKGSPMTCASKMLENFNSPYDATVIEKLKAQGMVFTGKLNLDEFAMGSSCENSYFKATKNPWDTSRVPGGSSGGSAAAVSAMMAPAALGTDTGGSIRLPSSFCGVVGLKPTYGAVSRYGVTAFASSLDQVGTIGRTVEDVALIFDAIKGNDKKDATSTDMQQLSTSDNLGNGIKGLKVGIIKELFDEGVTSEVSDAVMKAAKELENSGAELVEISMPSLPHALTSYYIISSAEASSNLARFDGVRYGFRAKNYANDWSDMFEKTRSEGFGLEVQRRILIGTYVLSSGYYDAYYKKAKNMQSLIQRDYDEALKHVDILLSPTSPNVAFKIGEKIEDPLSLYVQDACTCSVNIAGLPALSVPCGLSKEKLPIGMQLIGNRFAESVILNAAYEYEKSIGGFPVANLGGAK